MKAATWLLGTLLLAGGAAAAEPGMRDVGNGCKAGVADKKDPGRIRWSGPCESGIAHGLGYWTREADEGRTRYIARMQLFQGYEGEDAAFTAYELRDRQVIKWTMRGKKQQSTQVTTGDLPGYARTFLMEGKLPAPPKEPSAPKGPAIVKNGDCGLHLSEQEASFFMPKGQGFMAWVGGCRDGFAHGMGVLFQERRNQKNGVLYRYAVHYEAKEGRLGRSYRPLYIGDHPAVWEEKANARPVEVKRADVPAWASYVLGKGKPSETHVREARAFVQQQEEEKRARAYRAPPPGTELMEAGACKLYLRRHDGLRAVTWRGGCSETLADGDGLLEIYNANGRVIQKRSASSGVLSAVSENYSINDSGWSAAWSAAQGKWVGLEQERMPQWAREFLSRHPVQVAAAAPAPSAAADDARREREEYEERRRRREEEREERQARERAERERTNPYMEAMGAVLKGVAEGRQQQRAMEQRRQAQVAQIERDNARYREQRAAEDRRWMEQQQQRERTQQLQREREQEVQRQQVARLEQERRQPRWERVNLPAHTGCISVQWRPSSAQNTEQWYELKNGCPYTLNVHWCDRRGCNRSSAMATIPGGGSTKSWTLKKHGPSVSVLIACQVDNGGQSVHYDRNSDQCWSNVRMQ